MAEPAATADYPGIHIDYFEKPRRGYQINGNKVPSVTTVLGILDKKALVHWAARVTAEGCWKMVRKPDYQLPDAPWKFVADLKRHGYDHRSATRAAADRGVGVHDVLEQWALHQKIPSINDFPESRRGYIRGLSKWLMEEQPEFLEAEMLVGSVTHGFAGRRDTVAIVNRKDRGRCLYDLKTSKGIYPSTMFCQLAAYELAGVECGQEPTDAQAIVRVGVDGTYEVGWSDATADDFLAVLGAYKSQQRWFRR